MQAILDTFVANKKWLRILSIMLFVSFFMTILINTIWNFQGVVQFIVQLVINWFVYVVPAMALTDCVENISRAEEGQHITSFLEKSCEKQAKYFKVLAITGIIIFLFSGLGIAVAIMLPML